MPGRLGFLVDVGGVVGLVLESRRLELNDGLETSDLEGLAEWLSGVGEDVLGEL